MDPHITPEDPDHERPEASESDGSVLSVLTQARTQTARKADTLTLPVAAYNAPDGTPKIGVRYQYPDGGWERIRNVGKIAEADPSPLAELNAYALQIATCCAEIVGLDGQKDDGEWNEIPIVEGEHYRFTKPFAERLGIEVDEEIRRPSVHIVRHFFSPRAEATGEFRGDIALTAHALQIAEFLEKGKAAVAARFVGES